MITVPGSHMTFIDTGLLGISYLHICPQNDFLDNKNI